MSGNQERLPLTASQTWMWWAQLSAPDNPIYRAAEHLDVGPADPALLERALRRTIDDTEAMRVHFGGPDDAPWQAVDPDPDWDMRVIDLRQHADPPAEAHAWMRADLLRVLDLGTAPLFGCTVLRIADDRSWLHISAHHLLQDGFGFSLFIQRLAEVYTALEAGTECPPSGFGSLSALVTDELDYRASARFDTDREYWLTQLADLPEIRSLAGQHAPTSCGFHRETAYVPRSTADRLRALARQTRGSLPTVVMSAFSLHTHGITGADDVLTELVVTGRVGPLARSTPGMLSNSPPLRVSVDHGQSLASYFRHVGERARGLLRHQRYPVACMVEDLGLAGGAPVPDLPAINIMAYDPPLSFGGYPAALHNVSNGSVEDFTLNIYERAHDGSLRVDVNVNPALYSPRDAGDHLRRFLELLRVFAEGAPERAVGSVLDSEALSA